MTECLHPDVLRTWNGYAMPCLKCERDALVVDVVRLAGEVGRLKELLRVTRPVHDATCDGPCLDGQPERCGVLRVQRLVDDALGTRRSCDHEFVGSNVCAKCGWTP